MRALDGISLDELELLVGAAANTTIHPDRGLLKSLARHSWDVQELVALLPEAQQFFSECSALLHAPEAGPTESQSGTRIDHYEIIRAVGQGGMSTVYLANDTRVGRRVAIKLVPFERGLREDDFLREAQMLGAVKHPNVCEVYAAGFTSDGKGYLVMPFYEGMTVRSLIEEGPLELETSLSILEQLALGLAAAHQQGIVHGDIKPDNLILTEDGVVKIIDFGIARSSAPDLQAPEAKLRGTIPYLAPECFENQVVDEKAEIWALGITVWELLTGRRPFDDGSVPQMVSSIVSGRFELPDSVRNPAREIISRCLRHEPDHRWASAEDVVSHLEAARRPLVTRPWFRVAAIASVLILVGVTSALWPPSGVPETVPDEFGLTVEPTGWEITHPRTPRSLYIIPPEVVGDADSSLGLLIAVTLSRNLEGLMGLTPVVVRSETPQSPGRPSAFLHVTGVVGASDGFGLVSLKVADSTGTVLHRAQVSYELGGLTSDHLDDLSRRVIARFIVDGGTLEDNFRAIRDAPMEAIRALLLGQHFEVTTGRNSGYFRDAISLHPEFGLARYNEARLALHTRPFENSVVLMDSTVLFADQFTGLLRRKIAAVHLMLGNRHEEAFTALEELVADYRRDRYVHAWLGELQHHFGYRLERDPSDALEYFYRAYQLQPGNTHLLYEMSFPLINDRRWTFDLSLSILDTYIHRVAKTRALLKHAVSLDRRLARAARDTIRHYGYPYQEHLANWSSAVTNDYDLVSQFHREASEAADNDGARIRHASSVAEIAMARGDYGQIMDFDRQHGTFYSLYTFLDGPFSVYPDAFYDLLQEQLEVPELGRPLRLAVIGRNLEPLRRWARAMIDLRVSGVADLELIEGLDSATSPPALGTSLINQYLGQAAFDTGDLESAIRLLKAAETFPFSLTESIYLSNHVSARLLRSKALLELGRVTEAQLLAHTMLPGGYNTGASILRTRIHRGDILLLDARTHAEVGDWMEARRNLEEAGKVILYPSNWQARQIRFLEQALEAVDL